MTVSLAEDGRWTRFWVAGSRASTNGKDTEVIVSTPDGAELASISLMVRVRKDASTLTLVERLQFLYALSQLHASESSTHGVSEYMKYAKAHADANDLGIHASFLPNRPAFLAWHRAFLLSIERELQEIIPAVTIPYWRFDRGPDDSETRLIYSKGFMGTVSGDQGEKSVEFAEGNFLYGWQPLTDDELVRVTNGETLIPINRLQEIYSGSATVTYEQVSGLLEDRYHNDAHMGVGGHLAGLNTAAEDPLFFLLHANVDRAWALWQHAEPAVRFNPADKRAYLPQGRHPGHGDIRPGSYADDTMWPWSDEIKDWPKRYDMPSGPGVGGNDGPPSPASMIDYLDTRGTGVGIGACYDGLMF
jgi:tyrosinase